MTDSANEYIGDLIETVVWRVLSGVHTCFPAKITKVYNAKVDPLTTVVDVVAGLGEYNDITGSPDEVEILNIPLVYPGRTNNFIIRPPVDSASLVGSFVKISVSDTFIAEWKKTGGTNLTITDPRRFDRRDAIAEFGLYPDKMPWPTPPKDSTAQIKVKQGTMLEIGNSEADIPRMLQDLVAILTTNGAIIDAGAGVDPNPTTFFEESVGPSGDKLSDITAKLATLANPDP